MFLSEPVFRLFSGHPPLKNKTKKKTEEASLRNSDEILQKLQVIIM